MRRTDVGKSDSVRSNQQRFNRLAELLGYRSSEGKGLE